HERPNGEQISVFAREVAPAGGPQLDKPWLVFFQGGPGGKSPRPDGRSGWIKRALADYRVLLLDQRGTGRSTPVTHRTLLRRGSAQAQADYLTFFRADAIVQDAELIRRELAGDGTTWSALGQSYGGFCITTYLSFAPHGLREAFITGGLPPIHQTADEVYRATYQRVLGKNARYFERYPGDQARAQEIVAYLSSHDVRLPDGSRLTPVRFQALGHGFGTSTGFEHIHYLLDEAFVEGPDGRELSDTFLATALSSLSFAGGPIYAILHESIYCQQGGSHWSAERVRGEYPQFAARPNQPVLFIGEMVYPWMFDEDRALRPLREAATLLADYADWPPLYDIERLRRNSVPVAAAVYYDDMYVERAFSEQAAETIAGCRMWVTNEYEHNGLRADGERVLGRLIDMLHGEI
ncbi:MAG TPA: alpha/beta fold hydrolase, partial [Roseiflexaceae bacterium]|nr:alpha/beta fold hydrolase [Roseiflexaceae bacterium]